MVEIFKITIILLPYEFKLYDFTIAVKMNYGNFYMIIIISDVIL